MSLALSIFWTADLSRLYLLILSATDVSTSFGFGVLVADVSEHPVRRVAFLFEKRGVVVALECKAALGKPTETTAGLGAPQVLPLNMDALHTVRSLRA